MSAKRVPVRPPRPKARRVRFVKPQLMHHEALAVIDLVTAVLVGGDFLKEGGVALPDELATRTALDELRRAVAEYVEGRS